MGKYLPTSLYIYVYNPVSVYIYIYIYTHTHKYIYIYIYMSQVLFTKNTVIITCWIPKPYRLNIVCFLSRTSIMNCHSNHRHCDAKPHGLLCITEKWQTRFIWSSPHRSAIAGRRNWQEGKSKLNLIWRIRKISHPYRPCGDLIFFHQNMWVSLLNTPNIL